VNSTEWRHDLPKVTYPELYRCIEKVKFSLLNAHFADLRTLKHLERSNYEEKMPFLLQLNKGKASIDASYWVHLKHELKKKGRRSNSLIEYVVNILSQEEWLLIENPPMQARLKEHIEAHVPPPPPTTVKEGTHIVAKGDAITPWQLAALSAIQNALMKGYHSRWKPLSILSSALIAIAILISIGYYLNIRHPLIFQNKSHLSLYGVIMMMTFLMGKGMESLIHRYFLGLSFLHFPILTPLPILLLTLLFRGKGSLFFLIISVSFMATTLAIPSPLFMIINLTVGFILLLINRSLRVRQDLILFYGVTVGISVLLFAIYQLDDYPLSTKEQLLVIASIALILLVQTFASLLLLPLLERGFAANSDITLMEYMNPKHPLLLRMAQEAPGTHQHSMAVGSIAERAAEAIHADALFCKVASFYHDIGKLSNPQLFTENQLDQNNPHLLLTPMESSRIILSHVSHGIDLAKEYHLPSTFIDVIKEHHGTSSLTHIQKQADEKGISYSPKDFQYKGPRPRSKETTLIMMADIMEAASRSKKEGSYEDYCELFDQLIKTKIDEGQFDDSPLTFTDLHKVRHNISRSICSMRHQRLSY
ncbi:MAG: HDIG domain-containing metalloprotein, partial [Chlamydiota bacterium]|nr:HDIG domain-containing metalloprotein [Chlamydiota bacterium]